jgi:hypothetical protein
LDIGLSIPHLGIPYLGQLIGSACEPHLVARSLAPTLDGRKGICWTLADVRPGTEGGYTMNFRTWLTIVCVGMLMTGVSTAQATQYTATVIGQNDPSVDADAVQQAVDGGGFILLRGTFDFGASGRVTITRDVSIDGEVGGHGERLTTIKGGASSTFRTVAPIPVIDPGPKIKIRNLDFMANLFAPIHIQYTSGVEITGNHISSVVPVGINFPNQIGILVGTNRRPPPQYIPNAITGPIIVRENELDMANPTTTQAVCVGVWVSLTTGADIEIADNELVNCSRIGIEADDNFRGAGQGSVTIRRNIVLTPVTGAAFLFPVTPLGIVTAWFLDASAASDPERNPRVLIEHNDVEIQSSVGVAIFALGQEIGVRHNRVVMTRGVVGIRVAGTNNLVANNKITGTANMAVFTAPGSIPGLPATIGNVIRSNNVCKFEAAKISDLPQFPTVGDYVFGGGANDNFLKGESGSVIDLGLRNEIVIGSQSCDDDGDNQQGDHD